MMKPGKTSPAGVKVELLQSQRLCVGVTILLVAVATLAQGCSSPDYSELASPAFSRVDVEQKVERFCGDCHTTPLPEHFTQENWHEEVQQGIYLYLQSGRDDLELPLMHEVVEYFRQQAPEAFDLETPAEAPSPPSVSFRRQDVDLIQGATPAVSYLSWDGDAERLLLCEMRRGVVLSLDREFKSTELGTAPNPAHVELADVDQDGTRDLLVANLGGFYPGDHQLGSIVVIPGDESSEAVSLVEDLARVADVQVGDFNEDGHQDLLVAEFGWRKSGRTLLLTNQGPADACGESPWPKYEVQVVDKRHGTIHVPPVDLNGDGHLDFVALISQEHEVVEAFLNRGDGTFDTETIYSAKNPAFGFTGIKLVDLDQDDDLDILFSNGDAFDSVQVSPYHSVRWLENTGSYPYQEHLLVSAPGVHRALAGDLDGDGDQDVVAVAMLPRHDLPGIEAAEGVFWLEQVEPGEFVRHKLDPGKCNYASLEIVDLDQDGDLDIVAGVFVASPTGQESPELVVWWNEGA